MSEKRLASSGDSFVGLTEMQIVDLLNKLSDENTRLLKKVDEQQATISALKEENEQLRWDLQKTREDLNFFATLKVTAMKGNEPMDETTNLEHQTWTGGKR